MSESSALCLNSSERGFSPMDFASAHADLVLCGLHAWIPIGNYLHLPLWVPLLFLYLRTIIEVFRVCNAAKCMPYEEFCVTPRHPAFPSCAVHRIRPCAILGPARMQVPGPCFPARNDLGPASEPSPSRRMLLGGAT
jgi:hypothetical protein